MGTEAAFASLFPRPYRCRVDPPWVIQLVIVNWLLEEVPAPAHLTQPLAMLSGWRRQEVVQYFENCDWTLSMFPHPNKHENEMWNMAP